MNAVAQSFRHEERANVILTADVVDSRGSQCARISDLSPRGLLGVTALSTAYLIVIYVNL
ncbi:hypothetical protein [Aurantiacibacter gilvus]|uniref:Uncharacterized protein n=1 Tax=Aurantiacibacter gilvus TaxID=3139141 RepID=A0ABU9IBC1_9SPHN